MDRASLDLEAWLEIEEQRLRRAEQISTVGKMVGTLLVAQELIRSAIEIIIQSGG